MKYFHSFLSKLIFLNRETFNFAKKNFNISKKKICLITNGINTDYFYPINVKKGNTFKIGMACRVNRLKYYDLIANALNNSHLKNLSVEFLLAGDGEDLNDFKIRIKNLNLQKKVKFFGNLNEPNLKKWYAGLDVYIQASVGEGMPISLLQAMSMNIPVIGSRVSGTKEILGKKYVGLLFNNNVEDLAKKIKYFYYINKKEKLKYMNTQRKYVILKHNYKKIFNKYLFEIKNIQNI